MDTELTPISNAEMKRINEMPEIDKLSLMFTIHTAILRHPEWTSEIVESITHSLKDAGDRVYTQSQNNDFLHGAINIMLKKLITFKYARKEIQLFNLERFPEIQKLLQSK